MFDSIEFDNGFLTKIECEENKNKANLTVNFSNSNCAIENVIKNHQIFQESNTVLKKQNYYDLSLSVQDISASIIRHDYKLMIEEKFCKQGHGKSNEDRKNLCPSPLSPIKGSTLCSYKKHLSFSSTPLRDNSNIKNLSLLPKTNEMQKNGETKILKQEITKYAYIDADLFEDWNDCKPVEKNIQVEKNSFTISQAINFIEETEEKENEEHLSDSSIDLLTGKIIQCERSTTENLFLDSFNFSNVDFFTKENKKDIMQEKYSFSLENKTNCNNKSILFSEKKNKSLAVQKLNFNNDDIELNNLVDSKLENADIGFQNDDSFDAFLNFDFTQNLKNNNSKILVVNKSYKLPAEISKNNNTINSNDSGCFNMKKNVGEFNKIVESDSEDDESFSNFFKRRKIRNNTNQISQHENSGAMFLDLEAEVSDDADISNDESVEILDEYEKSFLDEKSYFTQNKAEDITAKYLESVKCVDNRYGAFKIPKLKPYILEDVYSEMSSNTSSNDEFDSFCVNDVEFDEHLSDLEIAEQVLKMDRRKRKKKKSCRK